MKNLACALVVTLFSVTSIFASNGVENEKASKKLDVKKIKSIIAKDQKVEKAIFAAYVGVCADGYRFRFYADNLDEAQGYVNGYCSARRQQIQ